MTHTECELIDRILVAIPKISGLKYFIVEFWNEAPEKFIPLRKKRKPRDDDKLFVERGALSYPNYFSGNSKFLFIFRSVMNENYAKPHHEI